jgi:hypothetical protein
VRGLAAATVVLGAAAFAFPPSLGATAGLLAGLCAFLLVAAVAVFVLVPGPDTTGALLEAVPLAGSVLVVTVLLVLSTRGEPFEWLWWTAAAAAALWTATALWRTRRRGG